MLNVLKTVKKSWTAAPFDEAILDLCRRRKEVIVLSADLSKYTDIVSLPKELPNQYLNVGMAEQNLMSLAGGLAKTGFVPIATTMGSFATRRAFDQMIMCMGTGESRGIVIGFTPGITNPARIHHQSIDEISMLRAVPGVTIIDPVDSTEFISAVNAAVDYPGLVYIRGHRGNVLKLFSTENYQFNFGDVHLLRKGKGVGIISTGHATEWVLEASEILDSYDIDHSILHVPTLKPVNSQEISKFCAKHDAIVTVENHNIVGGLGSIIAEVLVESSIKVKFLRLGVQDVWPPNGTLGYIRKQLGLDAKTIAENVKEVIS